MSVRERRTRSQRTRCDRESERWCTMTLGAVSAVGSDMVVEEA